MSGREVIAVDAETGEEVERGLQKTGGERFDLAQVGEPTAALEKAEKLVSYMAEKCSGEQYIAEIQGKSYPRCEWWTTVGAALGLFPREESCRRLERGGETAYEAVVGVYNGDQRVTRASAICSTAEPTWSNRAEYAIRSMALTRATSKAYRLGLSFLPVLAGLEPTPAEEMPSDGGAPGGSGPSGPPCPECAEPTWDNTDDPKAAVNGGKRPNWKCADRDCDWATWESEFPGDKGDEEKARHQARQKLIAEIGKHFEEPNSIKEFMPLLAGYLHKKEGLPEDGNDWTAEDFEAAREFLVDKGEEGTVEVQSWAMQADAEETGESDG